MNPEIQQALQYSGMFAAVAMLVFFWGIFDIKSKLKKIDKVDQLESILPEIKVALVELNKSMKDREINEARLEEQIKTLFTKYSELELKIYRIENK